MPPSVKPSKLGSVAAAGELELANGRSEAFSQTFSNGNIVSAFTLARSCVALSSDSTKPTDHTAVVTDCLYWTTPLLQSMHIWLLWAPCNSRRLRQVEQSLDLMLFERQQQQCQRQVAHKQEA